MAGFASTAPAKAAAPISVWFNTRAIVSGDPTPSRIQGTDFGSVGQGNPVIRRTFTVRNDSGAALHFDTVTVPVGYALVEGLDTAIAAGGQDDFTVRLNTGTAGTYRGDIVIRIPEMEAVFGFAVTGRVNPPGSGVVWVSPMPDRRTGTAAGPIVIDLYRYFDDIGVDGTVVRLETSLGDVDIELFDTVTPVTVENFLNYVKDGDYVDSFIHRAVTEPSDGYDFVIQGGGYRWPDGGNLTSVPTDAPIPNEFDNWFDPDYGSLNSGDPLNLKWTLAMAKLGNDPDSATSQWFVNLNDNSANLDAQNGGFTVFAKVIAGKQVVEAIADLTVVDAGGGNPGSPFGSLPVVDFDETTVYRHNLVLVQNAGILDELTFSINGNTGPSLVTADIDGSAMLTLTTNGPGTAAITVRATDLSGGYVEDTFEIAVDDRGDVNADGILALDDAIQILQLLSRSAALPEGLSTARVDADSDLKLGLAEAAYILQSIAGLR